MSGPLDDRDHDSRTGRARHRNQARCGHGRPSCSTRPPPAKPSGTACSPTWPVCGPPGAAPRPRPPHAGAGACWRPSRHPRAGRAPGAVPHAAAVRSWLSARWPCVTSARDWPGSRPPKCHPPRSAPTWTGDLLDAGGDRRSCSSCRPSATTSGNMTARMAIGRFETAEQNELVRRVRDFRTGPSGAMDPGINLTTL
jgi:hypothetical protein